MIKSIQKGTTTFTQNNQTNNISINTINPDKSVVIIDVQWPECVFISGGGYGGFAGCCRLGSLTADTLTLVATPQCSKNTNQPGTLTVSYQIIEYM